jgi:cytochrome c oxidase cbb3-type subunit 4
MSYDAIRHFADSYGLGAMLVVYLVLASWAFRPGSRHANNAAANMIFAEDGETAATNRDKHHG